VSKKREKEGRQRWDPWDKKGVGKPTEVALMQQEELRPPPPQVEPPCLRLWHRATHHLFPTEVQNVARTFLLCENRLKNDWAGNRMYSEPAAGHCIDVEVLYMILAYTSLTPLGQVDTAPRKKASAMQKRVRARTSRLVDDAGWQRNDKGIRTGGSTANEALKRSARTLSAAMCELSRSEREAAGAARMAATFEVKACVFEAQLAAAKKQARILTARLTTTSKRLGRVQQLRKEEQVEKQTLLQQLTALKSASPPVQAVRAAVRTAARTHSAEAVRAARAHSAEAVRVAVRTAAQAHSAELRKQESAHSSEKKSLKRKIKSVQRVAQRAKVVSHEAMRTFEFEMKNARIRLANASEEIAAIEEHMDTLAEGATTEYCTFKNGSYTLDFRRMCYESLSKGAPPAKVQGILTIVFKRLGLNCRIPSISCLRKLREEFCVIAAGMSSHALTDRKTDDEKEMDEVYTSIHVDAAAQGQKHGKYATELLNTLVHKVGWKDGKCVQDQMILLPVTQPKSNSAVNETIAANQSSAIAVQCRLDVEVEDIGSLEIAALQQHISDGRAVVSDSCLPAKTQAALIIQQQVDSVKEKHGVEKLSLMLPEELVKVFGGNVSIDCVRHLVNLLLNGLFAGLDGYAEVHVEEFSDLPDMSSLLTNESKEKVQGIKSIIWPLVRVRSSNCLFVCLFIHLKILKSLFQAPYCRL
jgi:hypothetical protein